LTVLTVDERDFKFYRTLSGKPLRFQCPTA
jgi:hypothetical protein